jgi:uncharacterized protein (DUF1697 family)
MVAFKKALEAVGFQKVVTYIQSGNVFVDTEEESPAKVGFIIKQEIFKEFGHDVPVIVIGKEDLQACLDRNLFLNEAEIDLKKLYVSFISSELPDNMITQLNLNFIKPDEIQLDGKRIYLKYDISPAKTKLDNKWIEKSMNVVSTTRNWNTVKTLLKMFDERN